MGNGELVKGCSADTREGAPLTLTHSTGSAFIWRAPQPLRALEPCPSPCHALASDRHAQVHQREVLAEAAAVAHDAVADVLPPEDQDQGPEEGQEPGEGDAQLLQEIREEAAEAAAAAGAPVVLTFEGETALGPEVPAKGAGARGGWVGGWRICMCVCDKPAAMRVLRANAALCVRSEQRAASSESSCSNPGSLPLPLPLGSALPWRHPTASRPI